VGKKTGEVGRGVREHKRGKERTLEMREKTQERVGENTRDGGREH
jgi:hypothetical protein